MKKLKKFFKFVARSLSFFCARAEYESYVAYSKPNDSVVLKNYSLFKKRIIVENKISDLLFGHSVSGKSRADLRKKVIRLYDIQSSYQELLHGEGVVFATDLEKSTQYDACDISLKALKRTIKFLE